MQRKRAWWGRLFILPWFIGAVYFFVVPMIKTTVWAFSKVSLSGGANTFVGFDNFIKVFTEDATFLPNLAGAVGQVDKGDKIQKRIGFPAVFGIDIPG